MPEDTTDDSGQDQSSSTPVDDSFQDDPQDQADGGQEAVDDSFQSDTQDQPDGQDGTPVDDSFQSDTQDDYNNAGAGTAAPGEDDSTPDFGGAASAGAVTSGVGMAASMVPAYIQCLDPSLPFPPINFPYNPAGFDILTEANWSHTLQPATQGPPPQWQGVKAPVVSVNMQLDAFAVPPIPPSLIIAQLKQMMLPTMLSVGMGNAMAPFVMFGWGPNVIMDQAYIKSIKVTHERFLLGVPVRATVQITLQAVPLPFPLGATNPTSGGIATRRTRRTVAGDTLASIAFQEYDDPNKWRALAEINKIDDPMRIKEGTVLTVPDLREAESLS